MCTIWPPQHPEWKQRDPFKAVLANDLAAMAKFSESDWEIILAATHAGMTTQAFQQLVKQWLATARDPRFHQPLQHSSTSRCLSSWITCGPLDSRPTSSLAAVKSSCGYIAKVSMASRPSRSWDRASRQNSRCGATFQRCPSSRNQFHRRRGRQTGRHQRIYWSSTYRRTRQFRWRS